MSMSPNAHALPDAGASALATLDTDVLGFVADMYGIQLDQLAALLTDRGESAGNAGQRARDAVAHWRDLGYVELGQLSVGEPWIWATRAGLEAFGLKSRRFQPGKSWLRHTRAVTEVRLALERTSAWRASGASWRSERQIRSVLGSISRDEHVPDAEVHWPGSDGSPRGGGIWAVEVELTRKTVERTATIMREALARTGEYGCPPGGMTAPGQPPRYAGVCYICSPQAVRVIRSSRAELGAALARRVVVHELPESAMRLTGPKRGWQP
jgi:hypothetical protein